MARVHGAEMKRRSSHELSGLGSLRGHRLQGTHRLTAQAIERKRRLKRPLHHSLREMSRTRKVEVYSAITKLDSFAPYFVQSRTLVQRS